MWNGWESARPLRERVWSEIWLGEKLGHWERDPSRIVSSPWLIDIAAPNRRPSQVSMPTSEASAGAVGQVISINSHSVRRASVSFERHRHKLWTPAMWISTLPVAQAAHDVRIDHCTICKKLITFYHFDIKDGSFGLSRWVEMI